MKPKRIRQESFGSSAPKSAERVSAAAETDVVVEFADLDKKGQRTPIPLWMERNADRIPWVKEELERVKAGKLAPTAGDIPEMK